MAMISVAAEQRHFHRRGTSAAAAGGGFLVAPVPVGGVFSHESRTEEQVEIADTAWKFYRNEVLPKVAAIEAKAHVNRNGEDMPLAIALLKDMGEMGLLAIDVPEAYGGLGAGLATSMIMAETCAGSASFNATIGAHNGIGMLPIVLFGDEDQKARYLPRLAGAEIVSCYALTEPGSGSDALSGKTQAVLSDDGSHYLLTGEKQFITNGAWADIGIVFARVDGRYSAFIVDLRAPGVTRGAEEKKMGIRGSSTTSLVFQEVRVPKEDMLGRPGDAATIALNILNLGRMKLGFGCLGLSKHAIGLTIKFGLARRQFGQPVITFDVQKGHLADMVAATWALEALAYRTVGEVDAAITDAGHEHAVEAVRAWALEASIVKVAGSETLQAVAGRAIRMHGGYGFVEEYEVERIARDNVIDTIFEGTNDINRLVIFDNLARGIFGAQIPFREFMEGIDGPRAMPDGPLAEEVAAVEAAKRGVAYLVEQVLIHCGKDVKNEQQVMEGVSDAMIDLYAADSALGRAVGADTHPLDIARLVVSQALGRIRAATPGILRGAVGRSRTLAAREARLVALLGEAQTSASQVHLKRAIADRVLAAGKYA